VDSQIDPSTPGGIPPVEGGLVGWWRDTVAEPLLSFVFPPRCVGCRDFESHLCAACRETLAAVDGARACARCGEPGCFSSTVRRCPYCWGQTLGFAGARSAFLHRGVARDLVAEFKFGGRLVLGSVMAELAGPAFRDYVSTIARSNQVLVTWVPAHRIAQRRRGYNQAEVLAKALARGGAEISHTDLVRKVRGTHHQKELGRGDRQRNLEGAFATNQPEADRAAGEYQALVLVDDVYTTGATAHAVSSVLTVGTGLPVYVFTFSRAVTARGESHD